MCGCCDMGNGNVSEHPAEFLSQARLSSAVSSAQRQEIACQNRLLSRAVVVLSFFHSQYIHQGVKHQISDLQEPEFLKKESIRHTGYVATVPYTL